MRARPHAAGADAPDPVGRPDNFQLAQDVLWATVLARAPGTLTLHTSDSSAQTFAVAPGVNKLQMPLTPGGYMRGVLVRDGQTLIDLRPDNYTFTASPQTYNYNAFTAFASAASGAPPVASVGRAGSSCAESGAAPGSGVGRPRASPPATARSSVSAPATARLSSGFDPGSGWVSRAEPAGF